MKKVTSKIQIIGENKKTKQAIIMVPFNILSDLQELLDEGTRDYQIAK